jgi:Arc/MetJ-type ribon-helix-helix transcriptional regulator
MSHFFHMKQCLLAQIIYDKICRNVTFSSYIYTKLTIGSTTGSKPGWDAQLNENADENERISLRLGPEELRMIDDFLAESNEFSNRSQLARAAIKSFIEKGSGSNEERLPNELLVVLPPLVLVTIKHLVEQGIYSDVSEAVADCTRHEFLNKESLEELKKSGNQGRKAAMQVVPRD